MKQRRAFGVTGTLYMDGNLKLSVEGQWDGSAGNGACCWAWTWKALCAVTPDRQALASLAYLCCVVSCRYLLSVYVCHVVSYRRCLLSMKELLDSFAWHCLGRSFRFTEMLQEVSEHPLSSCVYVLKLYNHTIITLYIIIGAKSLAFTQPWSIHI